MTWLVVQAIVDMASKIFLVPFDSLNPLSTVAVPKYRESCLHIHSTPFSIHEPHAFTTIPHTGWGRSSWSLCMHFLVICFDLLRRFSWDDDLHRILDARWEIIQ